VLPFSVTRIRWMLYGMAAGIAVVCAVALVARTMPDVIFDPALAEEDRLGYPLGYWNALGMLSGIGVLFCGHLACSLRDHWVVRALAAGAVPALTAVLYYTFSRGALWATGGALLVYLLIARPRGVVGAAIATAPPTAFVLAAINPTNDLTAPQWAVPEAVAAGHRAALAIGVACLAAAVMRGLLVPLDGILGRARLAARIRRPVLAGAAAALAVVALGGFAAADVPGLVTTKYEEFTADEDGVPSYAGSSRLLSAQNNGRREHWDVALAAFDRDRLHGTGAGTYGLNWAHDRKDTVSVQDAHSFYIELLGELGWPGVVFGASVLLLILAGFACRARGPDRALFATLLAAGLAWSIHAAVDWDWEMAAVTLWLFAFGGAVLARAGRNNAPPPRWTIAARVAAAALCVALLILPARVAISQARIDRALDAVESGECATARAEARGALSATPTRALPYHILGFCLIQSGRPQASAAAMRSAVQRDPNNWELRYSYAIALALSGADPRAEIRRALRLNPNEQLTRDAVQRFTRTGRQAWQRAGNRSKLTRPGPPTP
jgi:hypothetical protein